MDTLRFRQIFANIALAIFVFSTSIGAFILNNSAGFITLGITSGISALLLGADDE